MDPKPNLQPRDSLFSTRTEDARDTYVLNSQLSPRHVPHGHHITTHCTRQTTEKTKQPICFAGTLRNQDHRTSHQLRNSYQTESVNGTVPRASSRATEIIVFVTLTFFTGEIHRKQTGSPP